jgi:hypothetical protein
VAVHPGHAAWAPRDFHRAGAVFAGVLAEITLTGSLWPGPLSIH